LLRPRAERAHPHEREITWEAESHFPVCTALVRGFLAGVDDWLPLIVGLVLVARLKERSAAGGHGMGQANPRSLHPTG
jgi:hypothetical protein